MINKIDDSADMDTNVMRAAMYPTYIPSISRNGVIYISPKTNTTTGGGRLPTMIDRQCHGFIPSSSESMPNLMMGEASLRVGTGQHSDRERPRKETTSNPNQQSPSPSMRPNANLPSQPNPTHNQSQHHTHPPPSVRCCSAGGSLSEIPSRLTWAPLNGGLRRPRLCVRTGTYLLLCRIEASLVMGRKTG